MTEVAPLWTPDRIARLTALVAEGMSASAIAEQLGGVSRSAVLGKSSRLGLSLAMPQGGAGAALSRRAEAGEAVPKPKAAKPIRTRPEPRVAPPTPEPEVEPTPGNWPKEPGPDAVTLAKLDPARQCRMPLWANAEKSGLYCGKPVRREGSSWCAACSRLVFTATPHRSAGEL